MGIAALKAALSAVGRRRSDDGLLHDSLGWRRD
jgi:hypothetical protein